MCNLNASNASIIIKSCLTVSNKIIFHHKRRNIRRRGSRQKNEQACLPGIDIKYTIFAGGEVLSFSCKLENYMDRNAEKQEDFIDTAAFL